MVGIACVVEGPPVLIFGYPREGFTTIISDYDSSLSYHSVSTILILLPFYVVDVSLNDSQAGHPHTLNVPYELSTDE